jgi:hypothetical protein
MMARYRGTVGHGGVRANRKDTAGSAMAEGVLELAPELANRENEISSTEHCAERRWNNLLTLLGLKECDNHELR